ncbi:MAG: hypothetical protein NTW87_15350 [Planctomycetota bacterium]|nr:hypothetical protein [Planctomycetota bacterium]
MANPGETTPCPWLHCRLPTAIVLAFLTGWLTLRNLTAVYSGDGSYYNYGWPWRRVLTYHGQIVSSAGALIATAVNAVACLAILLVVSRLCEWLIRRWDRLR